MPAITSEYFYFSADGLIWFSTVRGLTSFDGSEIVYYSTLEQAEQFRLSNITTMTEDTLGNLYIGTENQLYQYNRSLKKFTSLPLKFPETASDLNIRVKTLYLDRNRILYIGLSSLGIQTYNLQTHKVESFTLVGGGVEECDCDMLQSNTVSSFLPHHGDTTKLWVGTYNGIYLFDKKKKRYTRNFEVENPMVNIYQSVPFYCDIRKMDMPNDSTIWFSTSTSGFGKYSIKTGRVNLFLHNARLKTRDIWKSYIFKSFAYWRPGVYILGIADPHPGIFDIRSQTNKLFSINEKENEFDKLQYIENDHEGNVWILNQGKLFASQPDKYSLKEIDIAGQATKDYLPNQIGQIYYDIEKHEYYAAIVFSSGIYVFDSLLQQKKIIPAPLYTNKWTYQETCTEWITKDGSGRYWASGMETYLYTNKDTRFDYAEKKFSKLKWIKTKGECLDLATTKEGDVMMRFQSGAIYLIHHKDLKTDTISVPEFDEKKHFEIGTIKIIYDSVHNKLYLNNSHTLVQYDLKTKLYKHLSSDVLFTENIDLSRKIVDYALDYEGRIWVWIPSYGIRVINPITLLCTDSIPVGKKGLLSGNYHYIRHGGKDFMLMIGGEGIVIYNYRKEQSWLLAYYRGIAGTLPYHLGICNKFLFANEINKILYYDLSNFSAIDFRKIPVLNTLMVNDSLVYTRDQKKNNPLISLSNWQNNLSFSFSAQEYFFPERIEYAYQLKGIDNDWYYTNSINPKINYTSLPPGNYKFRLKAQIQGGNWTGSPVEYSIIIRPAFWQTNWFKLLVLGFLIFVVFIAFRLRINFIKKREQQKIVHEKELLELEARALRAQMNPHFIFNSLNSIKSLINKNDNEKAAEYLITFSKLIRTLFQNSDKREISLYEELETCKLYTQLEKMRFGEKVSFNFRIDESIDLKNIKVPALILQPFIENSIWHGLVPKESGGNVTVEVKRVNENIECRIDDDGIGRRLSKLYQSQYEITHQSKGIYLTGSRLELDKRLNNRNDSIQIIDKSDSEGQSLGTVIVLTFNDNIV